MPDSSSARKLRIFIVENHLDTLTGLTLYLKGAGHEVFHAENLRDARIEIPKLSIDLLISDIGLPDGEGWQLIRMLRDDGLRVPKFTISISGYGLSSDRERSAKAGFREHLVKPFDLDLLDVFLQQAMAEISDKTAAAVR